MENRMANFVLTPLGKLFFASLINWIVKDDVKLNWNLRGDPQKVDVITKAIIDSKKFQQELKREGATVESVIKKLNIKNASAQEFQNVFGFPWPL